MITTHHKKATATSEKFPSLKPGVALTDPYPVTPLDWRHFGKMAAILAFLALF